MQYDFSAPEEGDLAISKGEKLWILDNNREHWWKAENMRGLAFILFVDLLCVLYIFTPRDVGNIPSNYVQEIGLSNER